jgi:hypothetical protein
MHFLERLQKTPHHIWFDTYLWADYFELLCIVNKDKKVSKADIIDRLMQPKTDYGDDDNTRDTTATKKEKFERIASEILDLIEYRKNVYLKSYPFKFETAETFFCLNILTSAQKTYLYLLFCSHLNLFSKSDCADLTSDFELISLNAIKKYMPKLRHVYIFGASSKHKASKYSGNEFKRVSKLAQDLKEICLQREGDIPPTSVGDGGLDIVGWYEFPDKANSQVMVFAQSKCSETWVSERHSSSYDNWRNRIQLNNHPNNLTLIPFCYRRSNGKWHKPGDTSSVVLIDRSRLMNLIKGSANNITPASLGIVDKILNAQENLV